MELIMMELMLAKVGGGEAVTNDTEEVAVAEVEEVEEGINEENETEEALDEAPGDENPSEEGDNCFILFFQIYLNYSLSNLLYFQETTMRTTRCEANRLNKTDKY